MKKLFYTKEGRKYVPVREYDSDLMNAFPKGSHVIICYPGGTSYRYNIDPAYAPMIAAGRVAEDVISNAVVKAGEMRPHKKPLTEEQRQAWEHLSKVFGDDRYYIEIPSAREIAEAGVRAMQEEALKLMSNPAVKKAYEHFILVCELTKDHNESKS